MKQSHDGHAVALRTNHALTYAFLVKTCRMVIGVLLCAQCLWLRKRKAMA
jgi:hypothetical protein